MSASPNVTLIQQKFRSFARRRICCSTYVTNQSLVHRSSLTQTSVHTCTKQTQHRRQHSQSNTLAYCLTIVQNTRRCAGLRAKLCALEEGVQTSAHTGETDEQTTSVGGIRGRCNWRGLLLAWLQWLARSRLRLLHLQLVLRDLLLTNGVLVQIILGRLAKQNLLCRRRERFGLGDHDRLIRRSRASRWSCRVRGHAARLC